MRRFHLLAAVILTGSAPATAGQLVPVSHFTSIDLRSGGDLTIVPGEVQRVVLVHGSTVVTHFRVSERGKLEITTDCSESCPHQYNLQIRVETPEFANVAVHSGGTIIANPGFRVTKDLMATVAEGGTIDLSAVDAASVWALIHAGGDIFARPEQSLVASVNAGGNVHYSGNADVVSQVEYGGNIHREEPSLDSRGAS